MIDFPNSPSPGDQFSNGTQTWQWSGSKWNLVLMPGPTGPTGPTGPAGAVGATGPTGPGKLYTARNTGDQSTTATTLTSITGLSFSVTSGVSYMIRFHGSFTSTATTTGFTLGFVSPPAVTTGRVSARIAIGGTTWYESIGDFSINYTSPSVSVTTGVFQYIIDAMITPSANGTIQLGFASEVSGSSVTHKAYSLGTMIEI